MSLKVTLGFFAMCLSVHLQAQINFSINHTIEFSQENGKWIQQRENIVFDTIIIIEEPPSIIWDVQIYKKKFRVKNHEETAKGLKFHLENEMGQEYLMDINLDENFIMVAFTKESTPVLMRLNIKDAWVDD